MGRYRFASWLDYWLAATGIGFVAEGCGKMFAVIGAAMLFMVFAEPPKRKRGP